MKLGPIEAVRGGVFDGDWRRKGRGSGRTRRFSGTEEEREMSGVVLVGRRWRRI